MPSKKILTAARTQLKDLIQGFGKNTYQSNNCTITSVFPHSKEKVNMHKAKMIKDCQEELSDVIIDSLTLLKVSAKR